MQYTVQLNKMAQEILYYREDGGRAVKWAFGGIRVQRLAMKEYIYLKTAMVAFVLYNELQGKHTSFLEQLDQLQMKLQDLLLDETENYYQCNMQELNIRLSEYLGIIMKDAKQQAEQNTDATVHYNRQEDVLHWVEDRQDPEEHDPLYVYDQVFKDKCIMRDLLDAFKRWLQQIDGIRGNWSELLDRDFIDKVYRRVRHVFYGTVGQIGMTATQPLHFSSQDLAAYTIPSSYFSIVAVGAFALCFTIIYLIVKMMA